MDGRVASLNQLRERLASLGSARPVMRPRLRPSPREFAPSVNQWGEALERVEFVNVSGGPFDSAHVYFDTETTGLSGGTGTLVFAASVARATGGGLELRQFFLAEPGRERAFLGAVTEALGKGRIASYNGRRFDAPILSNRCLLAGVPTDWSDLEHLDLLELARSLLRSSIGSCSLRNVEARVLRLEREEDLPSYLVPDAYFQYLRGFGTETLEAALAHNRQDVISLYYLHRALDKRLHGDTSQLDPAELLALGRYHLKQADAERARAVLDCAAMSGESSASADAAVLLSRLLIRSGEPDRAARMLAQVERAVPRVASLVSARARILEWRLRELGEALDAVEAGLARLPSDADGRDDLEYRGRRLRRRLARART